MNELFGQPYNEADPCWVVMCYMDIMYSDGRFIKAIECIVNRWGYSTDVTCS